MKFTKLFACLVCVFAFVACLAACEPAEKTEDEKYYTFHDYTAVMPSNWNELTYQDNNDTQIMSYIGSSFFGFDYKFDADGNPVPGDFEIVYEAATGLEDVTEDYVGQYGVVDGDSQKVYKITLRDNLKWDDGTPISAKDFVYSMKQQEDPLFKNYRADSFYVGTTIIYKAKDYVYQGSSGLFSANTAYATYDESQDAELIFDIQNETGVGSDFYNWAVDGGYDSYVTNYGISWLLNTGFGYGGFPEQEVVDALQGKTFAEIKADPTLKAGFDAVYEWWVTEPETETLNFFVANYTFPEVDFDEVGIFVGEQPNELIVALEKPLDLLKEDGSLSYKAAYNFASLPLVKEDLYEANKVAPQIAGGLWTSTYNQSAKSTASWGPYKLAEFQVGKSYKLVRNDNWYGYDLPENQGLYQTDCIEVELIESWNTAWVKFQAGELEGIGIDVSIAADYKNSSRAYFTPSDFIQSMQLQSDVEALKVNQENATKNDAQGRTINKTILGNIKFRKAISLGLDRADFCNKCTTASLAGFGLYNSCHYYDVANGKAYRESDEAKKVLCDVYAVDYNQFPTLDDAVNSITGYNPELAKQLITEAYNEELEAGNIGANDVVQLDIGASEATESFLRQFDYFKNQYTNLCVGTPLEGRIEFVYTEHSSEWANDFRAGGYDICTGGWSGAAWDPGYFLLAYLSPDYMYSVAWDTSSEMMTFEFQGEERTMSLMDWYDALNGEWSSAYLAEEERLPLIARLEKAVLEAYYTVPQVNSFSASLMSYKVDYISYEYNTFMGYGGIKYMTYNYTDAEWKDYKAQNGGQIDYTK